MTSRQQANRQRALDLLFVLGAVVGVLLLVRSAHVALVGEGPIVTLPRAAGLAAIGFLFAVLQNVQDRLAEIQPYDGRPAPTDPAL